MLKNKIRSIQKKLLELKTFFPIIVRMMSGIELTLFNVSILGQLPQIFTYL